MSETKRAIEDRDRATNLGIAWRTTGKRHIWAIEGLENKFD